MSDKSRADRIEDQIRGIVAGIAVGERVPTVRELSKHFGASPITIHKIFRKMSERGQIVTRPGSGTFVSAPPAAAAQRAADTSWQTVALGPSPVDPTLASDLYLGPRAGVIELASGYLDESLQPTALLRSTAAAASRRPGGWGRAPLDGTPDLKAWFADQLGDPFRPSDVLIVSGGQAALSTVFRVLVPAGAAVVMESPTYFGALSCARNVGARLVPVPTDRDGVLPDYLDKALAASRSQVIYLQPAYSNPTGSTLSSERRHAVLQLARTHGAFIVEDDFARELHLDGKPPRPLVIDAPERTIYLRSLTKAVAPAIRLAAIVTTGPVRARLQSARVMDDWFASKFLQDVAVDVVSHPAWLRHLRLVRSRLRERRDAVATALARHLPQARLNLIPDGGFNLWLQLPDGIDDLQLARDAERLGVHVHAGRGWFPAEASGSFVRISFAAVDSPQLRDGAAVLGEALALQTANPRA